MTPEERAEKIVQQHADVDVKWLRSQIAAEIRAAVEESQAVWEQNTYLHTNINKARREAFEEAAKIAEEENDPGREDYCGSIIAEKLRAKAREM